MIKGRKAVQQEQEVATRAAAADDGRGRPSAPTSEAGSGRPSGPVDPRAERLMTRAGISASELENFKSDMSIDDYMAMKAKAQKGGK